MNYILFDDKKTHQALLPLTANKSIADLKVGILNIRDKWHPYYIRPYIQTESYLQNKYSTLQATQKKALSKIIYINSKFLPTAFLVNQIKNLKTNEQLIYKKELIASYDTQKIIKTKKQIIISDHKKKLFILEHCWDILKYHSFFFEKEIQHSSSLDTRVFKKKYPHLLIIGNPKNVFIGTNVKINQAVFNVENGKIKIEDEAEIMEGSCLRGNVWIGKKSVLKMGTHIYGTTLIGCECVVSGEVKNSIINDYSNKAHYGYLGDSVIGSWCNLGSGTNVSNLKNTASDIIFSNTHLKNINLGKKAGIIIGDYSRTAINTNLMSNTIIGLCCNVFSNKNKNFKNFTWKENQKYELKKALSHIENWFAFRHHILSDLEKQILTYLHQHTDKQIKK